MISVTVQIDRDAAVPLRTQIASAYTAAIREGRLVAGTVLPSVRALSGRLGVSPVTVAAAYRDLCATGLATALPRSGVRVSGVPVAPVAERRGFELNRIEPDLRRHPVAECARLIGEVARDPAAGGYAEYRGERVLRDAIAAFDRTLGIDVDPASSLLITSGAQQALSLLGRVWPVGTAVAVEDPCYPGARLAFAGAGATLVPLAVGEDGPEAAALNILAEPGRVAAFYCCPTHANPTGLSWSEAARRRVLAAAQRGGAWLIEDDYLGDLDATPEALPRLAALAGEYPGARVVRVRTFSKTLLPALRLAGVSAEPALIARLLALKVADDLGCSALLQRALAAFLCEGGYQRHLERVRPGYVAVRQHLSAALAGLAPAITFAGPFGGFCLLGRLASGIDTSRFLAECAQLGLQLTPGADYWADGLSGSDCFRMGFGALAPDEVATVVGLLGRAALLASAPTAARSLL
ncbi:PLP-dependent aminotransferase family protein [uncultured Propionivibrio sp.]|uniref:aminotransferase-like domain-containing protein n=1 Tax=uncultured Propionivibrio sp. TaxID=426737 RepID=UPI0029BFCC5D|nr:PLP-dependent aminotransferase family protein [uncultured Propionivibrio sp.]